MVTDAHSDPNKPNICEENHTMRDIIAALLRTRGYTHDDEQDPTDMAWCSDRLGVRPMLACLVHEMNCDLAATGVSTPGWNTYEVSVAVAPQYTSIQ